VVAAAAVVLNGDVEEAVVLVYTDLAMVAVEATLIATIVTIVITTIVDLE
jgi:hypothetical protein